MDKYGVFLVLAVSCFQFRCLLCFESMTHVCTTSPTPSCYEIYHDPAGMGWQEAYSVCEGSSNSLATGIKMSSLNISMDMGDIWVGGKDVYNGSWLDMNKETFTDMHGHVSINTNCAVYNNIYQTIMGRKCGPDHTHRLALCQYKKNHCENSSMTMLNMCYIVPHEWFTSWNSALTYCKANFPEGTLAYTNISQGDFHGYIRNRLTAPVVLSQSTEIWVGVRRQSWYWIHDHNATAMEFEPGFPGNYSDVNHVNRSCLVMTSDETGLVWDSRPCAKLLYYALCSSLGRNKVTSSMPEPSSTTDVVTPVPGSTVYVTIPQNRAMSRKVFISVTGVVAVLLCGLVITAIILSVKLYREKNDKVSLPLKGYVVSGPHTNFDFNQTEI